MRGSAGRLDLSPEGADSENDGLRGRGGQPNISHDEYRPKTKFQPPSLKPVKRERGHSQ